MITILHNQSIIDVAVQESGSALAAFEWCKANGISITDGVTPGQQLNVPESKENSFDQVATFFRNNKIIIATKYTESPTVNYEFPQGELPTSL